MEIEIHTHTCMSSQATRVLLRRRRYIVADLDDTLVHKPPPGSRRKPADTDAKDKVRGLPGSPVYAPLLKWLERGHGLVVVTTDDGVRPYHLWDALPAAHRCDGQAILATSDGAALYSGDSEGNIQEVEGYKSSSAAAAAASAADHTAAPSASIAADSVPPPSTGLPQGAGMTKLLDICR